VIDGKACTPRFLKTGRRAIFRNGVGTSVRWQTSGLLPFLNETVNFYGLLRLLFRDSFETAELPCISMAISQRTGRPRSWDAMDLGFQPAWAIIGVVKTGRHRSA